MKKIISLYILMIMLILGIAVLMNLPQWTEAFASIHFPRFLHIIIEGINSLIMFAIFLVGNYEYTKTKDERLVILAGGFLIGSILNCVHIVTVLTFPYDVISFANLHAKPTLVYLLFGNLLLPFSIYAALLHTPKSPQQENFRFKIYSIYVVTLFILAVSPILVHNFFPGLTNNLQIIMHALEFINYSLYLILAFILINIRHGSRQKIFTPFTLGLIVLGLGGLFYINPLLIQANGILAHAFQLIGLLFLLFGIHHLPTLAKYLRFKDELVAYLCIVLISFYVIFVSVTSALFGVIFPPFSAYAFVEFLMIFQFIIYLLANKLTQPLTNIINALDEYKPGEEPIIIPIIRQDEIGILTGKINAISQLSWGKILELSKVIEQENSIIKIFESIRRVSNQNVIKNSIVDEIKTILNPDRVFIALYDANNDSFYFDKYQKDLPSRAFLTFCEEEDEVNEEKEEEIMIKRLNEFLKNNLELCFTNVNDYITKNSLEKTQKETLLKVYNVKSCCNIPIYYASHLLGCLVIQYTKAFKEFDNADLLYIKMMATQLGVAIHQ